MGLAVLWDHPASISPLVWFTENFLQKLLSGMMGVQRKYSHQGLVLYQKQKTTCWLFSWLMDFTNLSILALNSRV